MVGCPAAAGAAGFVSAGLLSAGLGSAGFAGADGLLDTLPHAAAMGSAAAASAVIRKWRREQRCSDDEVTCAIVVLLLEMDRGLISGPSGSPVNDEKSAPGFARGSFAGMIPISSPRSIARPSSTAR